MVSGLANGVPVTCTVVATNANGTSLPSAASNSVTPSALAPPVVNISGIPAPANEGSPSGTTNFVFTLTRTGPAVAFSTNYTITGDVLAPEDYTALSGVVSFAAADTTRTVTVAVKWDTKHEINENITLTLTSATNGVVVGGSFTATTQVLNDDNQPTISIGNRTVTEGGLANFAVTLSNPSYQAVSVTATTADGTANGLVTGLFPLADYTTNAPGGTVVTFAANTAVLSQNVGVATVNDAVFEGGTLGTPETYFVNLSAASGGVIGTGTGNGLVTDNDVQPLVSITAIPSQSETATPFAFTVTLNRQSSQIINVTATAMDGTAQQLAAPFPQSDFDPLSQLLTFGPGVTSNSVSVTVNDDLMDEANETFSVQLGSLVNVGAGTISRTVTLFDNDLPPVLSIAATSSPVAEEAGTATFTVSLSGISGHPVSVTAQTVPAPGTAIAGTDYTPQGPTLLSWTPGIATAQTFVVPITNDSLNETAETFRATLTGPTNATASPSFATMTIANIDPIPTVSISDVTLTEGNTPTTTVASFTVSLSAASGQSVSVQATTANGSATSLSGDYVGKSVNLVFPPGQASQQFDVTVNGDNILENDETFSVNLSSPSATVTILDGNGVGTINNDDSPALTIDDGQVVEGDTGQVSLDFNVHIPDPAPAGGVTFVYNTSDGSATLADNDYDQVAGGSGFIMPGQTFTTVSVPVNGDDIPEAFEDVIMTISSAALPSFPLGIVTILDNTGVGTIENDDSVPAAALVISEFRLSGPGGDEDEFIEIANTLSTPVTIYTTDGSAGFSVAKVGDVHVFTIPNGTTIPARGHLLAVNTNGYSLEDYGGVGAALTDCPPSDCRWATNIPDDTGLALFATSNTAAYSSLTLVDAAGFAGGPPSLYVEGPGIPLIGGPHAQNYSFVRKHAMGLGAVILDSGNNAADFVLVAVNAGNYGGTRALLGGPSPENLAAETERSNTAVTMSGTGATFTGVLGARRLA